MGTFAVLIGLLIYGIHPVIVEAGGQVLAPLVFASIAALMAGMLALVISWQSTPSRIKEISRSDIFRLMMAGVLGTFLAFTCLFLGLQITTSNNAAVILRSELVFALLFGYLFLGETSSWRQALWMSVMVLGVLLVVVTTQLTAISGGDLLLLVTPAAWAAGHTFAKPILQRLSAWTVVAYRNLVGGVLLALLALAFILLGIPILYTANLYLIIAIILIETVVILLAHGLWYTGISRINLGKATALIAPAPLVTFVLSTLIFQIPPTSWQLLGAALVIAATIFLSREVSLRRSTNASKPL